MKKYRFLDEYGTFYLDNPESTNTLYFPLANESGVMSCVTPYLGGDSKIGQDYFWLEPVSIENLHNNRSTRNFWVNIEGYGPWSATGVSARQQLKVFSKDKEETVLEAGILWHRMTRYNKDVKIKATVTSFVPCSKDTVELMEVVISNLGSGDLKFTATAAVPIYGRSADNIRDHRHVTSLLHRIKTVDNGVIVNPTLKFDERGHRKNEVLYGFFGSADGVNITGFYPTVAEFIGDGGNFEHPEAILTDHVKPVPSGYAVNGYEAMGGIRFEEICLKPGEEKAFYLVLGYGNDEKELIYTAEKYLSKAGFHKALGESKEYWKSRVNIKFETGNKEFDNWMYWVTFQPILRRIYGCSFLPHHDYGKGGRGWRDLWQDCLALLIMNPAGVREMILNNFGGVRIDGTNATIIGTKPGEFIADRNNITRVWMDHGVWPLITTKLYIEQTGDIEILLEEKEYFKDAQIYRSDKKDLDWDPEQGSLLRTKDGEVYKGSILEHILLQNLTAFYDVGEHNHIRLRGADWNDALDMAKERGESVAFTALYAGNLSDLADLIDYLTEKTDIKAVNIAKEIEMLLNFDPEHYDDVNKKKEVLNAYNQQCQSYISGEKKAVDCRELSDALRRMSEWIKAHIRKKEWITNSDGYSWFNGYYDNNGRQVEGDAPSGVRLMLTGQVFTVMSGTATDEQIHKIIEAVDKYLYDEKVGGYRLNTDFKELKTDLGRMFGFAYGHKENGAVFSHMAVMYAYALYKRNFVRAGFKAIESLFRHLSNFEKSKAYPGITEYINDKGEGMYHYLTGSASWLLLTVLTQMYGIKGSYGNLMLGPKLLKEQFDDEKKASVSFTFSNKKFKVTYYNKNNKEYGDYKISEIALDGKNLSGLIQIDKDLIERLDSEKVHHIEVWLI